jgi:hypothetical protein
VGRAAAAYVLQYHYVVIVCTSNHLGPIGQHDDPRITRTAVRQQVLDSLQQRLHDHLQGFSTLTRTGCGLVGDYACTTT